MLAVFKALAASPISNGVRAHSIIAVFGDGPLTGQTDGVVRYDSAHLDGVASKKVVRSRPSTRGNPETIEEVRRVLHGVVAGQPGLHPSR